MTTEKIKKFDLVGNLLDVELHGLVGFNEKEKEFMINALNIKRVIDNSQNYKMLLLSTPMTQRQGKSQLEIYNHWRSGYSNFNKAIDQDLDYFITLFSKDNGTLGYTAMGSAKIFINKKFYQYWMATPNGIAGLIGNLNHEYMHSMGYTHKGFGAYKKNSVPYVYGRIANELTVKHINGQIKLTPILEPVA